jgi:hypothetical protein
MHLLSRPKSKFKRFSKSCKVSLAADEIQLLQMCTVLRTLWQEVVPNPLESASHPQVSHSMSNFPKRAPGDLQIHSRDATNAVNYCNALYRMGQNWISKKNAMPKMIQESDPKSVVCYVLNVDR